MSASDVLIGMVIIIILIAIGLLIYFNFNNLFPNLKKIFTLVPEEPPSTTQPPETTQQPPETTQPPPPDTTKSSVTTKPQPPDTTKSSVTTKPQPPPIITKPQPPPIITKPPQPPPIVTKPPTKPGKPDTDACAAQGPFGMTPIVPIPNSVSLDVTDTSNTNMLIQEFVKGRVQVSKGVVTVYMEPTDGNGLDKAPLTQTDRQRNEISVKNSKMILDVNRTGTWAMDFKVNDVIKNWDKGHYHIIQIKSLDQDQPLFTVSFRGNDICARDQNAKYIPIQPICSIVDRWIPFSVTVINTNNGKINFNINGKTGSYDLEKPQKVYLKFGQYRATPNNIKTTTSTAYKNICFFGT